MPEKGLYTVVVADDETELREALCNMVPWDTLGFRLVGSAGNGLDALEIVEREEPDLLLTDIRMPFISGIELARQVREIRPSIHIAFLSGFDDFEYAKQAIQYNIISYMLKPLTLEGLSKELTSIREKMDAQYEALRSQTQQLVDRDSFLMPLVLDDFAQVPSAEQGEEVLLADARRVHGLESIDAGTHYVVMTLFLTDESGANCTAATGVQLADSLAEKYLRHASFFSGGKVVTLLAGNESDFAEYLHILTSELTQVAERVMHCHCSVGVSRTAASLRSVHAAYCEAVEALSFARPRESGIRFIGDDNDRLAASTSGMYLSVERVEAAVKNGARDELEQCLAEMARLASTDQYGPVWLRTAALRIIAGVYQAVYLAAGEEAVEALRARMPLSAEVFDGSDNAALLHALADMCIAAQEQLSSQQKKGGSALCQRALAAIDAHYMEESLSLVSLGELLHVSPNHLSACIKKYAGETFITLLIQKRMEAARSLLLSSQMKIAEVAQRCGYSDQHYFSYCFKKYCGVSPNALRRDAQKPAEEATP